MWGAIPHYGHQYDLAAFRHHDPDEGLAGYFRDRGEIATPAAAQWTGTASRGRVTWLAPPDCLGGR